MLEFHKMVPEGRHGSAEIRHVVVSKEDSDFTSIRAMQHPGEFVPPGTYVQLRVKGRLWMSDTRMERLTNLDVIRKAKGDVLIAGLGIGMILRDILPKPEVTSVTVVEINPDVAALMEPIIRAWPGGEKLKVVCKDIFKWKPAKGQLFDVVWFDIWADQTTDDRKDVTRLHRRAAWWCRPGAWVASWQVNARPRVSGKAS